MKEAAAPAAAEMQQSTTSRSGMATRSAVDKEKTKMRERHRRSITTKIFNGLRKHGGYSLSPRADINEVLGQLASEAGWTVEPDGTTYRGSCSKKINICAACGSTGMIGSGTPTPSSSLIGGVPGGGECSTTTSPRRVTGRDSMLPYTGPPNSLFYCGGGGTSSSFSGGLPTTVTLAAYQQPHHQQFYLQESRASNQNTPVGSPQRRV